MFIERFMGAIVACVAVLLTGCGPSTTPLLAGPSPLILASCPPLTPLPEGADTFGDTTIKLVEVSAQYRKCRTAVLGSLEDAPLKSGQ